MAAATLASVSEGQSVVRAFKFTALADTNTMDYSGPAPKAWWMDTTSSGVTAKVSASYSSGVFTFKVSTGTPDSTLFILL